jgi:hypothetical protein
LLVCASLTTSNVTKPAAPVAADVPSAKPPPEADAFLTLLTEGIHRLRVDVEAMQDAEDRRRGASRCLCNCPQTRLLLESLAEYEKKLTKHDRILELAGYHVRMSLETIRDAFKPVAQHARWLNGSASPDACKH